jgi:hypothetical protein
MRRQLCQRHERGRSRQNWDISEQPAGLFLLRYSDPEGTRWESKVIKG